MLQTPDQDDAIAKAYGNKFIIALDFESLHSVMPYYQAGFGKKLSYRTTFNDYGKLMQVSISSITIPPRTPGDLHQKFAPTICL